MQSQPPTEQKRHRKCINGESHPRVRDRLASSQPSSVRQGLALMHTWFSPQTSPCVSLQSSAPRIALGGTCHIGLRVGSRERRAENLSEVMTLHVICRGRATSDWYKGAVSIGWSWMSNMSDLLKAEARRWAGEKWACDISERKMRKCNKIISHYFRHHPARAVCPNLSSIQSSAYSGILILIPNKHTWAFYNYDG